MKQSNEVNEFLENKNLVNDVQYVLGSMGNQDFGYRVAQVISKALTIALYQIKKNDFFTDEINKCCIAGGLYKSIFYDKLPRDIDIYLINDNYINNKELLKKIGNNINNTKVREISFANKNYIKNMSILTLDQLEIPIELMAYEFIFNKDKEDEFIFQPKSVEDIINQFDLVPSSFGIEIFFDDNNSDSNINLIGHYINSIYSHPDWLYSVASKKLFPNDLSVDLEKTKQISLKRLYKYISEYGFTIDKEEFNEISRLLGMKYIPDEEGYD